MKKSCPAFGKHSRSVSSKENFHVQRSLYRYLEEMHHRLVIVVICTSFMFMFRSLKPVMSMAPGEETQNFTLVYILRFSKS